ncbi:MAG: glycosyltransferase family 2 protein [Bacteroidales bacterium]
MDFLNILTAWVVAFFLVRTGVLVYNYLTWPVLQKSSCTHEELVSVLIPARNEEQNMGWLLEDLFYQDYKNLEILVYDDMSEDRTREVVAKHSARDARIRLLRGETLPQGWLGKNHACHQLSLEARGHFLLFLDADVRLHPAAIASAMSYLKSNQLDALSVFPTQIMKTRGERAVVPLMLWVLLTLLPLPLVTRSRFSSLAAANGQFFLYKAHSYHTYRWHQLFRGHRVEDVAIARALKKQGLRLATLLGNRLINCRMYVGYPQALQGFAKNFPYFFGNNKGLMYVFILVSSFGWILPVIVWPWIVWVPLLLLLVLQRCFLARLTSESCRKTWGDVFIQQAALIHLAFYIATLNSRGGLSWKDRKIQ